MLERSLATRKVRISAGLLSGNSLGQAVTNQYNLVPAYGR